jgi:beta-glucosidase-like glycosyl hydrolase
MAKSAAGDPAEHLTWLVAIVPLQIKTALSLGKLSEEALDKAISRTLAIRFATGQFDPRERNPWQNLTLAVVNSREHRALAQSVVVKGQQLASKAWLRSKASLVQQFQPLCGVISDFLAAFAALMTAFAVLWMYIYMLPFIYVLWM